nr:cysteinyl leukotriene receptor 2-like [Hydra vulgaris]
MENTTIITTVSSTDNSNSVTTLNIIIFVLFAIIFLFGTIGNGLVLYYFRFKDKPLGIATEKRRISEFLFSLLSLVDFFAAALNSALYMYWNVTDYKWHLGYWSCKILVPLGTIATTMSGGIIAVLSFDRHRAIVYPFKSHFKLFHIKIWIFCVLVYSLLINAHYSINISLHNNRCNVRDTSKKTYSIPTIIHFFLNDCTLLFVINFTNYRIFSKRLHLSPTSTLMKMLGSNACKRRKKDNSRTIRLLVVMTIVFFLLTLPRDILQFVFLMSWLIGDGIVVSKALNSLNSFLKVFNVANSCVNPIIFYGMHAGFNVFIKSFFCKPKSLIRGRRISVNEMATFVRSQSAI